MRAHQIRNVFRIDFFRAERIHSHAHRLSHADRIGKLYFATVSQLRSYNIFSNVPRHVSRRPIDLRRIFSAESPPTMTAHPAVCIHNNLASRQTRVTHGPANHKTSRGIDVVVGIFIQPLRRDHSLNYMLQNSCPQLIISHGLSMLSGDHHRIHPNHFPFSVVLNRNLRLPIRPQKWKSPILPHLRKPHRKLVRQRNRSRHQLLRLITSIPKHHSLVAGAAGVYSHGDIARLFVDGGDYGAGIAVETVEGVVVSDGLDGAADYVLKIDVGFRRDFSGDDYESGGGQGFTGDAATGIFSQAGVEDGVRNLVGNFVGMAFSDRFGSEQIAILCSQMCSSLNNLRALSSGKQRNIHAVAVGFAMRNGIEKSP